MRTLKSNFFLFWSVMLILVMALASFGAGPARAQTGNLLSNPGFEAGASQTPTGWSESGNTDASKSDAGSAHSGSYKGTHWKASARPTTRARVTPRARRR